MQFSLHLLFRPLLCLSLVTSTLEAKPFKHVEKEYDQDLSAVFSWHPALLAKDEITPEMSKSMDIFSNSYPHNHVNLNPKAKGVDPKRYRAILARVNKAFPRDIEKHGPRRAVAIVAADPKAPRSKGFPPMTFEGEWFPMLKEVIACYGHATAKQAAALEKAHRKLAQALILSGFDYRHSWQGWFGNGYSWRNWGGTLPLMAHTLPQPEKSLYLDAIFNASEGCLLYSQTPSGSTDIEYNYYPTAFGFIARMENGPVKWQRLQAIRRGLDVEVIRGRLFTPDGGVIHHHGHHVSYVGYSLKSLLSHQIRMAKAGILGPLSKQSCLLYRKAVKGWAFNAMRAEIPIALQLRPAPYWESQKGQNQHPGNTPGFARLVADLTASVFGTPIGDDYEMARLIGSKTTHVKALPADWRHFSTSPGFHDPLQGHWDFPIMGASIHRHNNWMAVIRGANKFFRGGEVYAAAGYPGAYMDRIMHGALFIVSRGDDGRFPNSVDSGFRLEGFDPNMYPNVTANMIDNPSLAGRGRPDYMGGDNAKQGGSTSLNSNAVWSWNPATGLRKSAFFFGNRITLITSNISLGGKDVRTTLFQHARDIGAKQKLLVDGKLISENTELTLSGKSSHTLIDTNKTGYYIYSGNADLSFKLGDQGYTYATASQLKQGADKKILGQIARRPGLRKHINQFKPIVRPVSLAYFKHGQNPKQQSCVYHALVGISPKELQAFKANLENAPTHKKVCTIVNDNQFHYLFDRASSTHAVATFAKNIELPPMPEIHSINRPCTMMYRKSNTASLQLSIAATDLSDRTPFIITLNGGWKIAAGDTSQQWSRFDGKNTTLTLSYKNQVPIHTVIVPLIDKKTELKGKKDL